LETLRRKPKVGEEFTLPAASGVVAGGSLIVAPVFWDNGGGILNKLFGLDATRGMALQAPASLPSRRNAVAS
jgi:hypothetical protein